MRLFRTSLLVFLSAIPYDQPADEHCSPVFEDSDDFRQFHHISTRISISAVAHGTEEVDGYTADNDILHSLF